MLREYILIMSCCRKDRVMKSAKRVMTLLIMVVFAFSAMSGFAGAASKKYSMPTGFKTYCRDQNTGDETRGYSTGKWVNDRIVKIKYNKKCDPIRWKGDLSRDENYKISNSYKNGKFKKKVVTYVSNDSTSKTTYFYNKKGHLYKVKYSDGSQSETDKIQTNKKGWVTKCFDGGYYEDAGKISIKYYKNGSPKKMKNQMGEVKFNKNGLIKSSFNKWDFEAEIEGVTYEAVQFLKYSYKYDKKGRVKTVIVKEKIRFLDYNDAGDYKDSPWHKYKKIVFSYSKSKKTDHQRKWAAMIASGIGIPSPYDAASLPYLPWEMQSY